MGEMHLFGVLDLDKGHTGSLEILLMGIVRKAPAPGSIGDVILGMHPKCSGHAHDRDAPCCKVNRRLRANT